SITPMNEVTEAFAALEGEGDLSYEYWYNEHERFFRKELSSYNIEFSIDMDLVCQEFKVVDVK
ncbi:MAG TPA: ASCH domain-containing protein, partial [Staphylococcus arlettae]|nr:ASCH domain-containing protein [Staphylococcus arlettae]